MARPVDDAAVGLQDSMDQFQTFEDYLDSQVHEDSD